MPIIDVHSHFWCCPDHFNDDFSDQEIDEIHIPNVRLMQWPVEL